MLLTQNERELMSRVDAIAHVEKICHDMVNSETPAHALLTSFESYIC